MQFQPHFHLPLSDLRSDRYLWSPYRKPANFAQYLPSFHRHSMNISQIANLSIAGVEVVKLHNVQIHHIKIRSELKHWIATWAVGTVKVEPRSGSNLAQSSWFDVRSGKQPRQDTVSRVVRRVRIRTEQFFRFKPGLLAGYLDPLLTLNLWSNFIC